MWGSTRAKGSGVRFARRSLHCAPWFGTSHGSLSTSQNTEAERERERQRQRPRERERERASERERERETHTHTKPHTQAAYTVTVAHGLFHMRLWHMVAQARCLMRRPDPRPYFQQNISQPCRLEAGESLRDHVHDPSCVIFAKITHVAHPGDQDVAFVTQ